MWKLLKFCIYTFFVVSVGGVIGGWLAPDDKTVELSPSIDIAIVQPEVVEPYMLSTILDFDQNEVTMPLVLRPVEQVIVPETVAEVIPAIDKQEPERGPPTTIETIKVQYTAIHVSIEIEEIEIELPPIYIIDNMPEHLKIRTIAVLDRLEITEKGIVAHTKFVNSPTRGASDVFSTASITATVDTDVQLASASINIEPGQPSVETVVLATM